MSTRVKLPYSNSFLQINPTIIAWLVVANCIVLLASTVAGGAVFLSRSAWEAAAGTVGPITVESFDGIPQQEFPDGTTPNLGVIPFDITLLGGPGDPATEMIAPFRGGNGMLLRVDADNVFRINLHFHEPIYGFAANWFSTTSGDDLIALTIGVVVGEYLLGEYLGYDPGDGFFGIVSRRPFTRISFTAEDLTEVGEEFWMDNLRVVLPEPATILLFGLGSLVFMDGRK